MKPPLVTICLITYNYATLLEKAVQSLINQSYPNTQIIISDDQSTDNTKEVIQKIQSKNPQIIYRKNIRDLKTREFHDVSAKNIPTAKKTFDVAFNHCNSLITSGVISGEFVIFCHQDDIYHHDIVKKELEFLLAHPDIPAVFTLGNIINEQDKIVGTYKLPPELNEKNVYTFEEIFNAILNHGNTFLIAPTFMARKKIFAVVGLFDDHGPFGGSDDLEMWLRILEKFPIGIIHENLINWRKGGRGAKYNQLRTDKADFFKVIDYYLEDKNYIVTIDQKHLMQYKYQKIFDNTFGAMNFLIKGEIKQARNIINASFSFDFFRAFFENMNILRAKVLALKIILFIGINLGFGRYLGKILYRFA